MSRMQRDKGQRGEREIVNHWKAHGVKAERVPLSGAAGGEYVGDVDVYWRGPEEAPHVGESKVRADGFKTIYDWLGENDFLCIKRDRSERLYVIPERVLTQLLVKP